ncbi:MAG: hypothetical protein J0G30_06195 [Actinomycetales bacterium]|nr:hypothetical protein [Actinomycetales bacterium]
MTRARVGALVAALLFAVGYGWILFGAISNLVALPELYRALGIPETTPWALLVAGVALPPVLYAGALLLGRRRATVDRVILLAVGLAAASATAISGVAIAAVLLR